MEEKELVYESVKGNRVVLKTDGLDYEILINGMPIISTGDRAEGEVIAECIDITLNLLNIQGKLKIN